jgi:hypothetical protein
MAHTVNELTGEVDLTLDKKTYRLRASLRGMAELQAKLAVPGVAMMDVLLAQRDPRILYWGLVCLCTSGDKADFDTLHMPPHYAEIGAALDDTIDRFFPKDDALGKKDAGAGK